LFRRVQASLCEKWVEPQLSWEVSVMTRRNA
jgi:hypothetical protein